MEPGHEDREYEDGKKVRLRTYEPQWSPVMKTGNTGVQAPAAPPRSAPQWSPVMKTGNTWERACESGSMTRLNGARS
mgnify:CR=1 FL=1